MAAAGVLALVLSLVVVKNVEGPSGRDGRDGRDGSTVGAVPVINSPLEWGTGGTTAGGGKRFPIGSRVLCDIMTPNATSTGEFWASLQNPELYAISVLAGYGTTVGATTTSLGTLNTIGAGAGLNITASTTNVFFPPNTHIVLALSTSTSGTTDPAFNPVGGCIFRGSSY